MNSPGNDNHWTISNNSSYRLLSQNSAIYDKLSLAGSSHQEALCHAALDEVDPNIRFCGYRLRLAKDGVINVEELVKMSDANKGSGSDVLMREIEVKSCNGFHLTVRPLKHVLTTLFADFRT